MRNIDHIPDDSGRIRQHLENIPQKEQTQGPRPLPQTGGNGHRGQAYIKAGRDRIKNGGSAYSLTIPELINLMNGATDHHSIFDAITDAFYMGIEAGARMTEKRYRA